MIENDKRGWTGLTLRQRAGLGMGALAIVAAASVAGWYLLRPDYQVLFSDLAPQDAAAMVAELDRLKVAYRIEGADTILVPQADVHKTRMKLMAKDFPLRGAVGFELFSNADFGMTEFAQKVNYQRALQGELTRTIMAMDDVQNARVHIAIPEQGLFRKNAAKPKASITIAMKPGKALRSDQVAGIQRLVSAAIPDISPQDVTLVNQHGIALTRADAGDGAAEASVSRLDSKRAAEEYLARKATDVLDRALGAGQAMASVDVILNHDQTRVTTEDVLPATLNASANPTGVIVRQRQLVRDGAATALATADAPRREAGTGSLEVDYQVGRRTEQVVTAPGSIQRLGVAVVVRAAADKAQLERIKNLVAVAVGYDTDRGDGIAVYSMDQLPATAPVATPAEIAAKGASQVVAKGASQVAAKVPVESASAPPEADVPAPIAAPRSAVDATRAAAALRDAMDRFGHGLPWIFAFVALAMALAASGVLAKRRRSRRAALAQAATQGLQPAAQEKRLSAAEREATLARLREWLATDHLDLAEAQR